MKGSASSAIPSSSSSSSTLSSSSLSADRLRLALLLIGWAALVAVIASTGVFNNAPRFVVPALVAVLTVTFTVAAGRGGWFARAINGFSLKAVIGAHLWRFIGAYFLWLHARGRLPVEFAMRAGWGDIVAAGGALVLMFWPAGVGFRRAAWVWNWIGLLDLLLAVGTGAWLNATRPGSMVEIVSLPLALVPLFFVPIMLGLHFVTFRRLKETAATVA